MAEISARVLHVLSQRPSLTGSGVTFDALIRHAAESRWEQRAVIGIPADDDADEQVNVRHGIDVDAVRFLAEASDSSARPVDLGFPVAGMSDVMPYTSTVFSSMDERQLDEYRRVWAEKISAAIEELDPDVIHCHHAWLVASIVRSVSSSGGRSVPVVVHGHGTGLRQQSLCPHLVEEVRESCARAERFVVLHEGHRDAYARAVGVDRELCRVVGAGYAEEIFRLDAGVERRRRSIIFAGKLSRSKGLDALLDAFEILRSRVPNVVLRVAGSGAGAEADALSSRMRSLEPGVEMLGRLDQASLHRALLESEIFVLPSFYEGLPLVLVEALASGCRLVSSELPGVLDALAPKLGDVLSLVPMPRLASIDTPRDEDLPKFVEDLAAALQASLERGPLRSEAPEFAARLEPFTWSAVFRRVEAVWRELIGT